MSWYNIKNQLTKRIYDKLERQKPTYDKLERQKPTYDYLPNELEGETNSLGRKD